MILQDHSQKWALRFYAGFSNLSISLQITVVHTVFNLSLRKNCARIFVQKLFSLIH